MDPTHLLSPTASSKFSVIYPLFPFSTNTSYSKPPLSFLCVCVPELLQDRLSSTLVFLQSCLQRAATEIVSHRKVLQWFLIVPKAISKLTPMACNTPRDVALPLCPNLVHTTLLLTCYPLATLICFPSHLT